MTDDIVQPLKTDKLSLSARAQQYLLDLIEHGTYEPGEQLPSQSDLAAQLGISRPTLREALLNLEQGGVIVRKHGVGTFVAPGLHRRLESGLERLESVLELASSQGATPQFTQLEVEMGPARSEIADKLELPPGTPVTDVRRVIVVDGKPVAYMVDVVPSTLLAPEEIDDRFNGSVLDLFRQKPEVAPAEAVADIIALNADELLVDKLAVRPGQAVLLLEEVLFDAENRPVEFSQNYFCPDCFRFHVVRR
jgi:GntR family transcriptional regulator